MAERFYVYAIDDGPIVAYVGKGSGRRAQTQSRRFGLPVRILARFASETKAFTAERKWVATLKPELNKCAGGNGGRVRHRRSSTTKWERNLHRIGSRRYAARLLLACEAAQRGIVAPSKLEAIRSVAHGARA